jgi:ferredoxin
MKLKIEEYCMRCGVCIETCPDLFEMDETSAVMQVKFEQVPKKLRKSALKAVQSCGVGAIIIIKAAGR